MRTLGLVAAVTAIIGLILIEFVYRDRFTRSTYHWLLLLGMAIFPGVALLSAGTVFLEETKTVSSCASCHVMQPFVNDMRNPDSRTLAARHYQNRWIPDQQCYVCHTTYGIHGVLNAKIAAARHWFLYVSHLWQEPIRHRGKYPNKNCLACHANAQRFRAVAFHASYETELNTNQIGCIRCHGAPHPTPEERKAEEAKS